jgi:uncharacterized protein (TIGR02271 family)
MMELSVVAVFDSQDDAQRALDALLADGFSASNARITSAETGRNPSATDTLARRQEDESLGDKIARFFGFDDDYEETYSEAVRRGHYVLHVEAADHDEATRAKSIIDRFDPVDIDSKSREWRDSGWAPRTTVGGTAGLSAAGTSAPVGDQSIPLAEEQLQVGKREVQTGGVRVISRVVQRPVEADISLKQERATVARRPVDRAVTDSDNAFKEQTIEVRESAEEPVVSKTARVVEEVRVGKDIDTREETVRDTVRKTEVDVEQIGTPTAASKSRGGTARKKTYTGPERRRPGYFAYSGPERRAAA